MTSIELFNDLTKITNDLSISLNIYLVHTKQRNGCIIEKELYKTKQIHDILCDFLGKYFVVHLINNSDRILVLANTNDNKNINFDEIDDIELGKLISYPCAGDNLNHENRKYIYYVLAKKNNKKYCLMNVTCCSKQHDIFDDIIARFQKSIDELNLNIIMSYKIRRWGNIKKIITKLQNKKKLKNYEKKTLMAYFDKHHLIYVIYCDEILKINIYKYRKMLLTLLSFCDVINFEVENLHIFRKIFHHQLHILHIFINYLFDSDNIISIATKYLRDIKQIDDNDTFNIDDDEH